LTLQSDDGAKTQRREQAYEEVKCWHGTGFP
jgi:hypothetical protein